MKNIIKTIILNKIKLIENFSYLKKKDIFFYLYLTSELIIE